MEADEKSVCLEWDSKPTSIQKIINEKKLPVIVKLHGDDCKNFGGGTRYEIGLYIIIIITIRSQVDITFARNVFK